jgi:hypothetical protein
MKSLTEPHADRPSEPILSEARGYAPKRVRWPGALAVAILIGAAIGGMVVTSHEDNKRASGSPDRSVQAPAASPRAEPSHTERSDDTRVAQPARPAQPAQP